MATPAPKNVRLPRWLNDILVEESVPWYAPKPTMDDIVRRAGGVPEQRSPEDFIRMLARNEERAREAATRSVEDALTTEANAFGLPVKTIDQGRALGERNLPGIDNLSPEDQALLREALDKGAMIRAMPAIGGRPTITSRRPADERALPQIRVIPRDRLTAITGSDHPMVSMFGMDVEPTMSDVMDTLQNRSRYKRLAGMGDSSADLPPPAAYSSARVNGLPPPFGVTENMPPSRAAELLGPDIPDLLRQIRQDQIDSRMLTIDELNDAVRQADLDRAMRESADAVAAREAYARQYGGFPPDTASQMDRMVNRDRMIRSGAMDRMTGDPIQAIGRDPVPGPASALGGDGTYADWWERNYGNDMLKGFALGHVLSYPLMYGVYRMMNQSDGGASVPQEPARSIGADAALEDIPIAAAADKSDDIRDLIAAIPIEAPDMDPIVMPRDEVGIPEPPQEDMVFLEDDTAGAPMADDLPPPPTVVELDEELRRKGLASVPEWYLRAMDDPSVTMIDGKPKREAYIFSPQSKEFATERQYRMAGMK